jgi:histone deacetylase 1/2
MLPTPSFVRGDGGAGARGFDQTQSQDRPRPTCQLCGKLGHVASRCYKRFKKDFLGIGNDGRNNGDRQAAAATHGGHHAGNGGQNHGGHTPSYAIDPGWYADSGATDHLTSELDKLTLKERYGGKDKIQTANGSGMQIHHVGQSTIHNSSRSLHLRDVLHVPSVTRNLLSVPRFTRDNNVFFEFHPWYFFVKDRATREILLRGGVHGGLYRVDDPSVRRVFSGLRVSREQWHARLGHPATPVVKHILHRNKLPLDSSSNNVICDSCQQGKSHQLPFPSSDRVITKPLEFIYSDVWGPAQTSVSGHSYYVSFIDGYSRFTWLYLLKHKSDVFHIFLEFQKHVERLLSHKIIHVQSDWGGEYLKLNKFFADHGISHRVSCPHTHQQNGMAERKHRHIVETGLTLLAHGSVPFRFWGDAFSTACFLLNHVPSRVINM